MRSLNKIQHYDHKLFYWLHSPRYRSQSVPLSKCLSFSANGPGYLVVAIILGFMVSANIFLTLSLAFSIERTCYFIAKNNFKRARPSAALPRFSSVITPSDQFSFPSGHTSGAFLFAWIIGHYFPMTFLPLVIWACSVGLSRVLLGVHFLTDILAGALMGSLLACWIITLAV